MKKQNMKKILAFVLMLGAVISLTFAYEQVSAASKPAKPKVTVTVSEEGPVTVSIGKTKRAEGYQIMIKLPGSKSFTEVATLGIDGTKKRSYTIDSLPDGKYSIKVRAYLTKSGKKVWGKYSKVKTITVENTYNVDALGNTEDVYSIDKSDMVARIVNVTDCEAYYLVKLNFMKQYELPKSKLKNTKIGDVIDLNGKNVVVTGFYTLDDDGYYSKSNKSYTAGCRVVVKPENPEEFYSAAVLEDMDGIVPEFAFVEYAEDGIFRAFSDWEYDDCYAEEFYNVLTGVNLVVTENTLVHPCNYDYERYGDDFALTGPEYFKLMENENEQWEIGIFVGPYDVHIQEVLDDTGRSTGEISYIEEKYTP